jgi:DNA gyrase/topoisomerase IV subunit B
VLASEEVHNLAIAIGCDPGKDDLSGLRYGKVVILADADSDGLHIATLLSALFLKHFPTLVSEGHVFVAMPPLFRVDVGKQVFYCLDESEKRRDAAAHRAREDEGRRQHHALQGPGRDESAAAARIDHPSGYAPPGAADHRR